jgi:hypothetical protein
MTNYLSNIKVTYCPNLLNIANVEERGLDQILNQIKFGASKEIINNIRNSTSGIDKASLKKKLPGVIFSGTFSQRKADAIISYSGLAILDFDKVFNAEAYRNIISLNEYVLACWVSPSGDGVKALIKIKDAGNYINHYLSLIEDFPDADKSTKDISRLCFESYDENIYINENSLIYEKLANSEIEKVKKEIDYNPNDIISIAISWLDKKGNIFETGNRNNYIFSLACLLSEFGMNQNLAYNYIFSNFDIDSSFEREAKSTISSAYKRTLHKFNTVVLSNMNFVVKESNEEAIIERLDEELLNNISLFSDIEESVNEIFMNGYPKLYGISIQDLDRLFKPLAGEVTLISGYANYGKSSFTKWYILMRALLYDEKFAFYDPETSKEDFVFRFAEMYLGCHLVGMGKNDLSLQDNFELAKDFVKSHFIHLDIKTAMPTPQNILNVFSRLKVIEKISGVIIDPFNQMDNDYAKTGGRSDKYLETTLSLFSKFAKDQKLYFFIVAHPAKPVKLSKDVLNYPCPDYYDIADGAMWANKMDNILMFHRPMRQQEPNNPICQLHTKKIRKQQIVGSLGEVEFIYNWKSKRYYFNDSDNMRIVIDSIQ